MRRNLFAGLLTLILAVMLAVPATAAEDAGIVVYYTNDVHSYIDRAAEEEAGWTYSAVAALKAATPGALLVDAGDHIQGTAYGDLDRGDTVIALMNAAGYDAATLGNHEFDYGMERCMAAVEAAAYPYVSCNFRHEEDGAAGDLVLEPYVMLESGGKQIAFVGITTPETITASKPAHFQDADGRYIYGVDGGTDGSALYAAVQTAVDEAAAAGADYIIALGHLGVEPSASPWTSRKVIANVTGLDALIDGHSHHALPMETLRDKEGETVVLTQTGSYLDAVGELTIAPDGTISTRLLERDDMAALTPDASVRALEERWIGEVQDQLGDVIGCAEITLDNYDSEGSRLVRRQSTNSGDFAADALYYLFDEMGMDVDVAVINGAGVRNGAVTGPLSYITCKEIHAFGNLACLIEVTGQQILDALEWGSKGITADSKTESGGLLHPAGLRYTLDLTYDSTVQADEQDIWVGPPTGEYRVKDVQVLDRESGRYEPLELTGTYRLAGYNYTLRDLGDGFAMFTGATAVLDDAGEDYMVLANYIRSFPADETTGLPTLSADSGYADVNGSGRITLLTEPTVLVDGTVLRDGAYLSEAGQVSDTAPAGGYAHYENGVLTLNHYTCRSGGTLYGRSESGAEAYYAVIHSEDSLHIELLGENRLQAIVSGEPGVFVDGIVSNGSITLSGSGSLLTEGFGFGISADDALVIRGVHCTSRSTEDAIGTFYGPITIEDAVLELTSDGDGIYTGRGLTAASSTLTITAAEDGIYSYDGPVLIDNSELTVSAGRAVKADNGALTLGEGLTLTVPEQGSIRAFDTSWDADGDGIKETHYRYHTVVDAEGEKAGTVCIRKETASITRAEAVYDLWTLAGAPVVNYHMSFTDVPQEAWYAEAVRWAASEGIAAGYDSAVFGPGDPVSRQQLAAILYRFEQTQGGGFGGSWMFLLQCTDRADVAQWAYEPMCWMTMNGLLSTDESGALRPRESLPLTEARRILSAYQALE